jgi:hypothetical protein
LARKLIIWQWLVSVQPSDMRVQPYSFQLSSCFFLSSVVLLTTLLSNGSLMSCIDGEWYLGLYCPMDSSIISQLLELMTLNGIPFS